MLNSYYFNLHTYKLEASISMSRPIHALDKNTQNTQNTHNEQHKQLNKDSMDHIYSMVGIYIKKLLLMYK
jgi:hypothetical protein